MNEYPIHRLVLKAQVCSSEFVLFANVFGGAGAFSDPRTRPPSHRGVIVVSAGVGDEFANIVVRAKAGPLRVVSKSKLEQAHAGKTKLLAKTFYFRGNHTEILSDEGQLF